MLKVIVNFQQQLCGHNTLTPPPLFFAMILVYPMCTTKARQFTILFHIFQAPPQVLCVGSQFN